MTGDCRGERRTGLLDLVVAVLLGAGAFALYVLTLAPTVLAGDGGEFQFVPYLLGVAHPTGYPLYTLLGWAWSRLLPVGDVAFRLNLFSALAAAAAVGLVYPTTRSLLRQALPTLCPLANRLIAVLAAAILAVTPTLWSQAIMAEVYGLHLFLIVLLFCLLLAWGEQRSAPGSASGGWPPAASPAVGRPQLWPGPGPPPHHAASGARRPGLCLAG